MLIFGPYRACVNAMKPNRQNIMFNFSSLREDLPRLNYLIPNLGNAIYAPDIDIQYSNYLCTNDLAFSELMQIVFPLYQGANVFICTSGETSNQYIDTMNELLQDFIKVRYGYNSAVINDPEDLDSFDEGDFGFSVRGVQLMDQDRERWILMNEKVRLASGGEPYK